MEGMGRRLPTAALRERNLRFGCPAGSEVKTRFYLRSL